MVGLLQSFMVVCSKRLTGLCFSHDTFKSIMNLEDMDSHHESQQFSSMRPLQTPAARRFQRSRQHLGLQRHDLLVAMRVVNSIEREVLQAEWENWLLEENIKCKHMGAMLSRNTSDLLEEKTYDRQHVRNGEPKGLEEMRAWQRQYCESCNKALQSVSIGA